MKIKMTFLLLGLSIIITFFSIKTAEGKDYFEGTITYKNEYTTKTDKIDLAYLNKIFGKRTTFFFKEGNYLEVYDNGLMLEQLYNKQRNKIYVKRDQGDTLYWMDCRTPDQKILKYEINRGKETILGIDCDELVTYYPNKTVSFYFNADTLSINPEWYKNFALFNKNWTTQKMKAVYLKYKIEYQEFIVTVTATSITSQKMDDKIFSVPKNKILIKDK